MQLGWDIVVLAAGARSGVALRPGEEASIQLGEEASIQLGEEALVFYSVSWTDWNVQQASFAELLPAGCCRGESMVNGDHGERPGLSNTECRSTCAAAADCVGFEFDGPDRLSAPCEPHLATVTQTVVASPGCAD